MNKKMKKYNNIRFFRAIIISVLLLCLSIFSFVFMKSDWFVAIGVISLVACIFIFFLYLWLWISAKKVLNNPTCAINSIEELNAATEKRNDENLKPFIEKMEKVAEVRGKMEAMSDKYKYAEIAKTVKETINENDDKSKENNE